MCVCVCVYVCVCVLSHLCWDMNKLTNNILQKLLLMQTTQMIKHFLPIHQLKPTFVA